MLIRLPLINGHHDDVASLMPLACSMCCQIAPAYLHVSNNVLKLFRAIRVLFFFWVI